MMIIYADVNLLYVFFHEVLNSGNRFYLLSTFITYFNFPYIALNNISTAGSFCFKGLKLICLLF